MTARKRAVFIACISSPGLRCPPYVYGQLRAFAELEPRVRDNYTFDGSLFIREDLDALLAKVKEPSIFAVSLYVWNAVISMELCREVKRRFPDCLTLAGGPQVPDRGDGFLDSHPYIDVLVHGEGEIPFRRLLLACLDDEPNLLSIAGLSFRREGQIVNTGPGEKLPRDIDIPSPYLAGYLDESIEQARAGGYLPVLWETNRGCPYGCTFCDWGSDTMSKLRLFSIERLQAEIEFFSRIGVDIILGADANFGILPRDLELTEALARAKEKAGYPDIININYAKNSNARVFEIAQRFKSVNLLWSTTLSMQSTNEVVLKAIDRATIGTVNYKKLKAKYLQAAIPTYTEVILGLPAETKATWIAGLCDLVDDGHDDIRGHWLVLLPNAPLNDPRERETYGLVTIERKLFRGESETAKYVVETSTMSNDDWVESELFSALMIRTLHVGGYTKFLSAFLRRRHSVSARQFYGALFEDAKRRPDSPLGWMLEFYVSSLKGWVTGDSPGTLDQAIQRSEKLARFVERYPLASPAVRTMGEADVWEFFWLLMNEHLDELHRTLPRVLGELGLSDSSSPPLRDVLKFARDVMLTPDYDPTTGKVERYEYDWHRYFFGDGALRRGAVEIMFTDTAMGSSKPTLLVKGHTLQFHCAAIGINDWNVFNRCHHQPQNMRVTQLEPTKAEEWDAEALVPRPREPAARGVSTRRLPVVG